MPAETGGLQYMLTVEKESQPDDTVLRLDRLRFLMGSDSVPSLMMPPSTTWSSLVAGWGFSSTIPCSPRAAAAATATVVVLGAAVVTATSLPGRSVSGGLVRGTSTIVASSTECPRLRGDVNAYEWG